MADRESPIQANFPIPEDFVIIARRFRSDVISVMLGYVWQGYDRLRNRDDFTVNKEDAHLEDDITAALHARIQDAIDPFSPLLIIHQPVEGERQRDTGRPPQSDLGFRLRDGNVRSHFSIEAKVIKTDGAVSEYVKEITRNLLTGRYSTFSSEAAMLGYLLSGTAARAFAAIATSLQCVLAESASFPDWDHRCSCHQRDLDGTSGTTARFRCHHMLMVFR